MIKLLAIALLCIGWYGPGGGALRTTKPKVTKPKPSPTAAYRHYRGVNELKLKHESKTRTYRWLGPPQHGWISNPYVRPRKRLSR